MTPSNTMFTVGQKVRHKASHKPAVITAIVYRCTYHQYTLQCFADSPRCQCSPTGNYEISCDFLESEEVSGVILEPFPEGHPVS